jgi:Skp family chaperone for outer membrane proteins
MAETTKDLQKQYDAALAAFTAADAALKSAGLLNLASAQKTFDTANKAFQAIKTRYDAAVKREQKAASDATKSEQKKTEQQKADRESLLRQAQIDVNSVNRRLAQAAKGSSPQKIAELTSELNSAQAVLNAVENGATGKLVKVGGTSRVQIVLDQPVSATPTSAPSASQGRATAQMRGEGVGPTTTAASTETVTTPTVTTPSGTPATPAGSPVSTQSATSATDQKTFVDSELTKRKLKDTPANREKLRKEFQTKNKPVDDMAWMDEFKKTYAAYSDWTTNQVVDHFGQDFVDILKEAVNTEFTDEEIQARIKGTQYFKSITDSQYKFDGASSAVQNGLIQSARDAIVKDYADVGLAQTDIDEIARKVARNGLTATGVKQAVYQYAFRKPAAATTPTSPGMARNAIEGGDADAIRQAARAYGYNVSDAEMQAALTGGMYNGVAVTKDSILQKAQKSAKGKYFHLADQIDAGLSLEDIFSGYRNYAADALEIDPNQIDFTKDSKWARAFGTKETGQMSLTDWVTTIKSDPSFGWQYTKQANQQATDIGLTLARAFGKVA